MCLPFIVHESAAHDLLEFVPLRSARRCLMRVNTCCSSFACECMPQAALGPEMGWGGVQLHIPETDQLPLSSGISQPYLAIASPTRSLSGMACEHMRVPDVLPRDSQNLQTFGDMKKRFCWEDFHQILCYYLWISMGKPSAVDFQSPCLISWLAEGSWGKNHWLHQNLFLLRVPTFRVTPPLPPVPTLDCTWFWSPKRWVVRIQS
jgi:hypothetical protein